jgi:hypothetical protein
MRQLKAGLPLSLLAIFRYTTWRRLLQDTENDSYSHTRQQNDSYSRYVSYSSGLFIYDKVRFSPDIPAKG